MSTIWKNASVCHLVYLGVLMPHRQQDDVPQRHGSQVCTWVSAGEKKIMLCGSLDGLSQSEWLFFDDNIQIQSN